MSNNEQWCVGSKGNEKAFDIVRVWNQEMELFFGEFPHARQENTMYARTPNGSIYGFDGHRKPIKIEVEEYNYLKQSELSGDEIRKGCSVKVFVNGVQVLDDFARNYENGYRVAHNFIISMEGNWSWFPHKIKEYIGREIYYDNHPCKIKSFIVSQGCMMLEPLDGKPFPLRVWEDDDDERESEIKVSINSPSIWWWKKK